jgi:hypothetical protein
LTCAIAVEGSSASSSALAGHCILAAKIGRASYVVGGVAALLHGAMRVTYDLDIVYDRSFENLQRLVAALTPLKPYPRDARPALPFRLEETLKAV